MTKVLFLAMHRTDRSPSQRFRFEQYFDYLNKNGIQTEFSYLISQKQDPILYSKGGLIGKAGIFFSSFRKRLTDLKNLKSYDFVFIQREAFLTGTTFFEKKIKKSGVPIIFDFDDSIWLPDRNEVNRNLAWLKNPKKTQEIIALADTVVAGNEYLADFSSTYNESVIVIPTTIDTIEYQPIDHKPSEQVTIGWSGSFSTIKHFEESLKALQIIKADFLDKVIFKVIGDSNFQNEKLSIQGQAWNKETEVEDLNTFNIGIMPLPDDDWSKGKCGLKGLQYMALEIPTIMSPVGVNTEIIQDGVNGFLASSDEEWVEKLTLLIENPDLRQKLGKAGRQTVIEKYSVEANKHKYLEIFNGVINNCKLQTANC